MVVSLWLSVLLVGLATDDSPGRPAPPVQGPTYDVLRTNAEGLLTLRKPAGGAPVTVRLLGVELPPTDHDKAARAAQGKYLNSLLKDGQVRVVTDPKVPPRSREDLLGQVYRVGDNLWINQELIRAGYGAAAVSSGIASFGPLREAERQAREQAVGLWSPEEFARIVDEYEQVAADAKAKAAETQKGVKAAEDERRRRAAANNPRLYQGTTGPDFSTPVDADLARRQRDEQKRRQRWEQEERDWERRRPTLSDSERQQLDLERQRQRDAEEQRQAQFIQQITRLKGEQDRYLESLRQAQLQAEAEAQARARMQPTGQPGQPNPPTGIGLPRVPTPNNPPIIMPGRAANQVPTGRPLPEPKAKEPPPTKKEEKKPSFPAGRKP